MMELGNFAAEVIGVSASGVLAPGPLFFANILHGSRQGATAGLKVAYGHGVVELALVAALAVGLVSSLAILEPTLDVISVVGGLAILGFATVQLAGIGKIGKRTDRTRVLRNPFVTGMALSILNPFFLIWWFTAGLKLISDSLSFGLILGIAMVFGFHIWMDFAWLIGSAYLSSKGTSLLKSKYYRVLVLILIAVLISFGISFILSGLS